MSATTVQFVSRATTVYFPVATISSTVFLTLLRAYNDALPFFNSNEDALAGTAPDGSPTTALTTGNEYKAGPGHMAAPYGAKLIVI